MVKVEAASGAVAASRAGVRSDLPAAALPPWPEGRWKQILASAVTEPAELLGRLRLDDHDGLRAALDAAGADFPLRVPEGFVERMRPGDPDDPLLLQVLPQAVELGSSVGYTTDPLGEVEVAGPAGVLHKYHGRALLVVSGACAIHCRYCFRRHFPYDAQRLRSHWEEALAYLEGQPEVEEIILSGGDPLAAPDPYLARLTRELSKLAHLRRLRIHTRLPVVIPERVDAALLGWLEELQSRMEVVVVLHVNHAQEIDRGVRDAVALLRQGGTWVLNQAVLLRRINDRVSDLCELSEALFGAGVLPYYLHLLDRVQGASHFAVDAGRATALVAEVAKRLPGYLVPRLVQDVAGAPAKVVLGAC